MKIFDENNEIVENPDLTKGELQPDVYIVIARHEGDKWVTYVGAEQIDVPVEISEDALPQNDLIFTEEILRYHVWTEEELEEKEKGTVKERVNKLENSMEFAVSYDEMQAAIMEGVNEV